MKTAKKVLMITSLACLVLSCLLLILAIFGVSVFEGFLLRILLISSTFAVGGGIAISELNVVARRKILGLVSVGFLGLSVLLAVISFITPLIEVPLYNRITGVVALFSVLLAIISSLNTKLEKRFIPLQVVTYIAISAVVLLIVLLVCTVPVLEIPGAWQIFGTLCVVSVGLLIATAVVGSKKKGDEKQSKVADAKQDDLLQENQNLKAENEQLKAEIEKLKAEIESFKSNNQQ